ncbi:ABC transporter permease [Sporolactobacillus vineae]|jgi:ABC-2 type transport system permease protein|uniref:ABC transporter permease n=1 Tax=Sporolactobacillus vineae TaxID=444463 RepID=UPI0002894A54|nr:ABC transporter permease [Sporolactobacillus vineae]
MSGNKLFFRRVVSEFHYQQRVLKTIVDWSIMLYLAIPSAVIIPFIYADVWRNIHIYWNARIPVSIVLLLLLILSGNGTLRTGLLDADLLFLIQRRKAIRQLKRDSFIYSMFVLFLVECLLLAVALPVLIGIDQYTVQQILSLMLLASAFKLTVMMIKKSIDQVIIRWLFRFLSFSLAGTLLINASPMLWAIFGGIFWAILLWLNVHSFSKINHWEKDLEAEYDAHSRLTRLILRYTNEIPKPRASRRKKPFLFFRNSSRFFRERSEANGLLEFLLKSVLRNKAHLSLYYRLIGITCLAVLFLPVGLKWAVYVLFIWFMNRWLRTLFRDISVNDFFILVPYHSESAEKACFRFQKWLGIPPDILVGILAALSTFATHSLR